MSNLPHFDPPGELDFATPFWDGIGAGELRIPQCSVCGAWQWYPDEMGTCCAGGELAWKPVSGRGTVYTTTTVRRPFLPDGADDVPFQLVFVDLDDAPGVRFVGNTTDEALHIGERVRLSFEETGTRKHPVFHRLPAS